MLTIPDISFYQYKYKDASLSGITGYVDFVKMKTKTPAVIIRAGQKSWVDRTFDISWQRAKDADLLRGSYWFFDSRANPKRQAELYVQTLGRDTGELPLWADFEDRYGGEFHGWRHWHDFIERIKQLLPNKMIGVYTNYYYWKENTSAPLATKAERDYFLQYPLWVANYTLADKPQVPTPFDSWALWQYTDNGDGKAYGVQSGNIDLNYFDGNMDDFLKMFNVGLVPSKNILVASLGDKRAEYKEV